MSKRVFISYRREDTAPAAGRLYDRLCAVLSKADVFFDVSAIGGGEDFERRIGSEIDRSNAVLVLVGRRWLEPAAESGAPRLIEQRDYVRAELRAALQRNVMVLPVLVDGARMPQPELLPEDVKALATKNALPLRHESFDDDAENIVRAIFGAAGKERPWEDKVTLPRRAAHAIAGVTAGLLLLVIVALLHRGVLARPLSASIGEAGTTLLLIAVALAGGWFGYARAARKRKTR